MQQMASFIVLLYSASLVCSSSDILNAAVLTELTGGQSNITSHMVLALHECDPGLTPGIPHFCLPSEVTPGGRHCGARGKVYALPALA